MVKSIEFDRWHLIALELNETYEARATVLENYKNMGDCAFVETIADSLGRPLAIFTGIEIVKGNMEVSALVGPGARTLPVHFFRHVKRRRDYYWQSFELRRMQATIRAGHGFLLKWIRLMGFKPEGLMQKFGPEGDDYFLYARVN